MKRILSTVLLISMCVFAKAQSFEAIHSFHQANTGAGTWVLLGKLQLPQQGLSACIQMYAGQGYNAYFNQQASVELFIRTSNGSSVDPNGFGFSAYAMRFGGTNTFIPRIRIKPNVAGANAGLFEIYAFVHQYIGEGFYSVKGFNGGWQHLMTAATEPSPAYEVPFLFKTQNDSYLAGDNFFVSAGTGNVGIGTTNPQQKLSVNGTILTKKVMVSQAAQNWPDYVFAPEYKLPSLLELEQYVKQHQHLPEIPSAKEVEQNGLDLAETNKQMLKKIEELTLYIIELKKESLTQQASIEAMQKEISALKK